MGKTVSGGETSSDDGEGRGYGKEKGGDELIEHVG